MRGTIGIESVMLPQIFYVCLFALWSSTAVVAQATASLERSIPPFYVPFDSKGDPNVIPAQVNEEIRDIIETLNAPELWDHL